MERKQHGVGPVCSLAAVPQATHLPANVTLINMCEELRSVEQAWDAAQARPQGDRKKAAHREQPALSGSRGRNVRKTKP